MTDEQRLEEPTKKLEDDSNEDVEAHRRRIAEEPKDTDKSEDDVEAHRRR